MEPKKLDKITAIDILDELDEFRRNHQNEKTSPSDFCMRAFEAIIAKRAGFMSRCEWTDELKKTNTRYSRDICNAVEFF